MTEEEKCRLVMGLRNEAAYLGDGAATALYCVANVIENAPPPTVNQLVAWRRRRGIEEAEQLSPEPTPPEMRSGAAWAKIDDEAERQAEREVGARLALRDDAFIGSQKGPMDYDPYRELLGTVDAVTWAHQFVKHHGGDEELMVTWFANAILAGMEWQSRNKPSGIDPSFAFWESSRLNQDQNGSLPQHRPPAERSESWEERHAAERAIRARSRENAGRDWKQS